MLRLGSYYCSNVTSARAASEFSHSLLADCGKLPAHAGLQNSRETAKSQSGCYGKIGAQLEVKDSVWLHSDPLPL